MTKPKTEKTPEEKARDREQWRAQRAKDAAYELVDGFDFDTFVQESRFVFAKSAAETKPHEYTVRGRTAYDPTGDDAWFLSAAMHIRRTGYKHDWGFGTRFVYLDHEGWHYWTMGNTLDTPGGAPWTIVLNRAKGLRPQGTLDV